MEARSSCRCTSSCCAPGSYRGRAAGAGVLNSRTRTLLLLASGGPAPLDLLKNFDSCSSLIGSRGQLWFVSPVSARLGADEDLQLAGFAASTSSLVGPRGGGANDTVTDTTPSSFVEPKLDAGELEVLPDGSAAAMMSSLDSRSSASGGRGMSMFFETMLKTRKDNDKDKNNVPKHPKHLGGSTRFIKSKVTAKVHILPLRVNVAPYGITAHLQERHHHTAVVDIRSLWNFQHNKPHKFLRWPSTPLYKRIAITKFPFSKKTFKYSTMAKCHLYHPTDKNKRTMVIHSATANLRKIKKYKHRLKWETAKIIIDRTC
eukprot:g6280.t1